MAYKMNMSPKEERTSQRLFGTDGVRGVANVYPMTAEVAMQLGRALAYLIRNGPHRHRVIIGKDTRLSGLHARAGAGGGHHLDGRGRVRSSGRCPRRASPTSPRRCAPTRAR